MSTPKMVEASTPLAQALRDGSWPALATGDDALATEHVEAREQYADLKRQLVVARETIQRKNEEYAALLTEARPEKSLEVAMLRNRSKEWESLTAENTRLRLQLAAMSDCARVVAMTALNGSLTATTDTGRVWQLGHSGRGDVFGWSPLPPIPGTIEGTAADINGGAK